MTEKITIKKNGEVDIDISFLEVPDLLITTLKSTIKALIDEWVINKEDKNKFIEDVKKEFDKIKDYKWQ